MKTVEGLLTASGLKIGIVVARFNGFITEQLLQGAIDGLSRHGVKDSDITVVKVPGSFEIPLACKQLAQSKKYDAVIALGAVIRGATTHYDLVAGEVAKGVNQVSMQLNIPVIFGVITTDTIEQAIERSGTKAGNKGFDAAQAAIEMAQVIRQLNLENDAAAQKLTAV